MKPTLKLINMRDVAVEEVKWIWYPYIPSAKMTVIQGDPGEGKTTLVLALIALLTNGEPLPESEIASPPVSVIYQTAEDGLADTIKPRLLSAGAECSRVLVIDESDRGLNLCDKRLEQAIRETGAKLIVLDPLQAYLSGDTDMNRANELRQIFKRVCLMMERTGCAVILIGHFNKAQGMKSAYRGLGSIDIRAAARSVLVVGRTKDDLSLRIVAHDKSSLAPEGKSIAFEIHPERGFLWKGFCDVTVDDLLSGNGSAQTKTTRMESELKEMLSGGAVSFDEIMKRAGELKVSERTLNIAKSNLGIVSKKQGTKWFWSLEDQGCKGVTF